MAGARLVQIPDSVVTDVAALKAQSEMLGKAMQDLAVSVSGNFAAMNAKFEVVTELIREVTRMQEMQKQHSSAFERTFKGHDDLQHQVDELERSTREWQSAHEQSNQKTDRKLVLWHGIAIGLGVFATIMVSLVVYMAQTFVSEQQAQALRMRTLELEYARQHGQPVHGTPESTRRPFND